MQDSGRPTEWRVFKSVGAVVVIPLFVMAFSLAAPDLWLAAAALAVLLMVLALVLPAQGSIRPQQFGRTPAAALAAGALTVLFVIMLAHTAHRGSTIGSAVLPGMILWAAATVALRPTSDAGLADAALSTAATAGSVAVLLFGVAVLRHGDTLFAVGALLLGVAFLLAGVAALRDGDTLLRVVLLLSGVGLMLSGVDFLRQGDTLVGVGALLFVVAVPLYGFALLRHGRTLLGVAVLLVGVGFLRDRGTLLGVALLLVGVGLLLMGVGLLLIGFSLLRHGGTLLGSRSCWPCRPVSRSCLELGRAPPPRRRSRSLGDRLETWQTHSEIGTRSNEPRGH